MTLQATGSISLANLQTEFYDTSTARLGEFYQGQNRLVQPPVPASGALDLSDFKGAKAAAKGNVTMLSTGTGSTLSFVDMEEDVNRHYVILGTDFSASAQSLQPVPTINGIACQTIGNRVANGGDDGSSQGIFTLKLPTGTGVFTVENINTFVITVYRVTGCISMAVPLEVATARSTTASITASDNGCFFGVCVDNFSSAPLPYPNSEGLTRALGTNGSVGASNSTSGPTQTANMNGNQGNLYATFAYDIY